MEVPFLRSPISPPTFQVKAFGASPFQPLRCQLACGVHRNVSYNRSTVIAQYGIPDKAKMQLKAVKEKLWEPLPDTVKDFPWKKAKDQVLERMLVFSLETFKWFFLAWFPFSFLSDVAFTISRNQEIVLPLGLFAGCLLSEFMKETSEDLFQQQQVKGINLNFLGVASFFYVLKLISTSFSSGTWIFLLHVANGGLMQILWLWNRSHSSQDDDVKVQS